MCWAEASSRSTHTFTPRTAQLVRSDSWFVYGVHCTRKWNSSYIIMELWNFNNVNRKNPVRSIVNYRIIEMERKWWRRVRIKSTSSLRWSAHFEIRHLLKKKRTNNYSDYNYNYWMWWCEWAVSAFAWTVRRKVKTNNFEITLSSPQILPSARYHTLVWVVCLHLERAHFSEIRLQCVIRFRSHLAMEFQR